MHNTADETAAIEVAPLRRASREDVRRARSRILMEETISLLMETMPAYGLILNEERQVLAVNDRLLTAFGIHDATALVGKRPGEAINCIHADEGVGGCGTGKHCAGCGAVMAILQSQQQGHSATREFRITMDVDRSASLDLEVTATPMHVGGMKLTVFSMRDISAEKRRDVLERVFFHDIINTAGGIHGLAEVLARGDLLTPEQDREYRLWMVNLAQQLVEEVTYQQELVSAEKGDFRPTLSALSVPELLRETQALYANHDIASGRSLVLGAVPECHIVSDRAILRRILGNMVKNALEAAKAGEVVTISAETGSDTITLCVHNPGVIPLDTQLQIFQRSFSTKADAGRGIGTYSIKLFGERYLGGKVGFCSREPDGTIFSISLPRELPSRS
ncbi:MAG: histidine kinase [Geobacter sp.]|nr:MAG: histidine kinase [Geobacter sp.]